MLFANERLANFKFRLLYLNISFNNNLYKLISNIIIRKCSSVNLTTCEMSIIFIHHSAKLTVLLDHSFIWQDRLINSWKQRIKFIQNSRTALNMSIQSMRLNIPWYRLFHKSLFLIFPKPRHINDVCALKFRYKVAPWQQYYHVLQQDFQLHLAKTFIIILIAAEGNIPNYSVLGKLETFI